MGVLAWAYDYFLNSLPLFFMGIGFGVVGLAICVLLAMWLVQMKPDPLYPDEFVKCFVQGFKTALVEEPVFRFLGIWLLSRWIGVPWAFFISSTLFGLGHLWAGWRFTVVAWVAGLVFSLAYIMSGWDILVPMTLHGLAIVIWFGAMRGGVYGWGK